MGRAYRPFDNYILSIPAEPHEAWRNHLQLLYDNLKSSIADPLTIDGQWYDMHEEYSDVIDERFGIPKSHVIVGLRALVYQTFIPAFLKYHQSFFTHLEYLNPSTEIPSTERRTHMRLIAEEYRTLIDTLKQHQQSVRDHPHQVLAQVSKDFGFAAHLEDRIDWYGDQLDCFRYPRCTGMLSKEYAAALGDSLLLRESGEGVTDSDFFFIAHDEVYIPEVYPGFLTSYPARLRFSQEILAGINLEDARTVRMFQLLRTR